MPNELKKSLKKNEGNDSFGKCKNECNCMKL